MIDEFKKSGKRKIHLTMKVNFVSSKDNNDKQLIHSKCDNMQKSWLATKTDEINHKLFKLLINRDELGLQESRKGRDFAFDSINKMCYKCNKISLNRGGLYIDSFDWIKSKKLTINPKNNNDKLFQYTETIGLNNENIVKNPQQTSQIKPIVNNYTWKEMRFPLHLKDWKIFQSKAKSNAVNVLFAENDKEKIKQGYISKHNFSNSFIYKQNGIFSSKKIIYVITRNYIKK